jgi:hypothetical protein
LPLPCSCGCALEQARAQQSAGTPAEPDLTTKDPMVGTPRRHRPLDGAASEAATAQQGVVGPNRPLITGVPGSPNATVTIDGRALPPPPQPFHGEINAHGRAVCVERSSIISWRKSGRVTVDSNNQLTEGRETC